MEEILAQRMKGEASLSTELKAKAHCVAGIMAFMQFEHERANIHLESSSTLFHELDSKEGEALAWLLLGLIKTAVREDASKAMVLLEGSVQLFRELGKNWETVLALNGLGWATMMLGDRSRTTSLLTEGLELAKTCGENMVMVVALNGVAWAATAEGQLARALDLFKESLQLSLKLNFPSGTAAVLEGCSLVVGLQGDFIRAARLLGAAEALRETTRVLTWAMDTSEFERAKSTAQNNLDEATFAKAWAEGKAMSFGQAVAYALGDEAETHR